MIKSFLIISVISFIFIGCASHEPIPTNSLKSAHNNHKDFDGIIVKNRAYVDKEELSRYFDVDTLEYGVLPVKVYIKNKKETPLDLKVENIKLVLEDGQILNPLDKTTAYDRLKKNTAGRAIGWGLAFGVIGIATSSITASSANDKISAWLDSIMLKDTNLAFTDEVEGKVLYAYSLEPNAANDQDNNSSKGNKRNIKGAKLLIHVKECDCESQLNVVLPSN